MTFSWVALRPSGRFASFVPMDWVFVFLAWLTLWYLVLNILDALTPVPQRPFDILPILAGVPIVILGWKAVRLRKTLDETVDRLDDGAGLVSSDETAAHEFSVAFRSSLGTWSWAVSGMIVVIMLGGLAYAISAGLLPETMTSDWAILHALLGLVMVGAGFVVGLLLGRFVGFGFLHRMMQRHGVAFASLSTPGAQRAIRGLEGLLEYAVLTTMTLCHWFAFWFLIWKLGCEIDYRSVWSRLYYILWIVSTLLYMGMAWFPGLAFLQRMKRIFGDVTVSEALERQIAEARIDLEQMRTTSDGSRKASYRINELSRFIESLSASRSRPTWLKPALLHGLLVWNITLFVGLMLAG